MFVQLDKPNHPALLEEHNFQALKVKALKGSSSHKIESMLGSLGRLDGEQAWLSVEALKRLGPDENAWREKFAAMVAYAEGAGWVSKDKAFVQAHIDLSES